MGVAEVGVVISAAVLIVGLGWPTPGLQAAEGTMNDGGRAGLCRTRSGNSSMTTGSGPGSPRASRASTASTQPCGPSAGDAPVCRASWSASWRSDSASVTSCAPK